MQQNQPIIEERNLRSRDEIIKMLLIPALFVAILIIASIVTKGLFLDVGNLLNVTERASIVGIIAIGMTVVLLTGGIDLSVGAVMCMGYSMQATLVVAGLGQLPSIILSLAICFGLGAINGILVAKTGLPPFMITLGTMMIITALSLYIARGSALEYSGLQDFINSIGFGTLGSRLLPTVTWLALTFLLYLIFIRTKMGLIVTAIGANKKAALLSGIKSEKTIVIVYGVCGLFSGIAAIVLAYRLGVLNAHSSDTFLLESIAAVVIGGTSIMGGEGSILRTLFGAVIIAMLVNLMNLLMIDTYLQFAVRGVILILIVAVVQRLSRHGT